MAGVTRRVLVTGGNKGIGKALCKQLVADHGFFVLLGSRDKARGEAAVKSIIADMPQFADRIEMLQLDVTQDASVKVAAEYVSAKFGVQPLYGIVNNAGVGFGLSMQNTLEVNTYGAKRVCDAFIPLLSPSSGRVCNTASASGPMYVAGRGTEERGLLTNPEVTWQEIDKLMSAAISKGGSEAYGFSKACLNAYTMVLAKDHPNLIINSFSPGFILTDITRGMGATKPPKEGTKAGLFCLTGDLTTSGRYYGSDAVRSPLDRYRGPGDPPYTGP